MADQHSSVVIDQKAFLEKMLFACTYKSNAPMENQELSLNSGWEESIALEDIDRDELRKFVSERVEIPEEEEEDLDNIENLLDRQPFLDLWKFFEVEELAEDLQSSVWAFAINILKGELSLLGFNLKEMAEDHAVAEMSLKEVNKWLECKGLVRVEMNGLRGRVLAKASQEVARLAAEARQQAWLLELQNEVLKEDEAQAREEKRQRRTLQAQREAAEALSAVFSGQKMERSLENMRELAQIARRRAKLKRERGDQMPEEGKEQNISIEGDGQEDGKEQSDGKVLGRFKPKRPTPVSKAEVLARNLQRRISESSKTGTPEGPPPRAKGPSGMRFGGGGSGEGFGGYKPDAARQPTPEKEKEEHHGRRWNSGGLRAPAAPRDKGLRRLGLSEEALAAFEEARRRAKLAGAPPPDTPPAAPGWDCIDSPPETPKPAARKVEAKPVLYTPPCPSGILRAREEAPLEGRDADEGAEQSSEDSNATASPRVGGRTAPEAEADIGGVREPLGTLSPPSKEGEEGEREEGRRETRRRSRAPPPVISDQVITLLYTLRGASSSKDPFELFHALSELRSGTTLKACPRVLLCRALA
ncbi:hypothetical protein CYMTET_29169 [Cymbomonas tetramitiformis]|uniref:Uncharacterized protein n=1 Tax=Cymbomonas tetramitiformis TaxID=36881 RepID=A0AAE0FLI5_9CHLO|nr:hypothetical protein CYMTET_29169 [Cymbomonas tetramitiformis]